MKTNKQRLQRKTRVRSKILGTREVPRLSVFRSNNHIYAQLIDDVTGKTILGVSDKNIEKKNGKRIDTAKELGNSLAKQAVENKISKVMFDRGYYKYHGRVKALAEGAREGGLKF